MNYTPEQQILVDAINKVPKNVLLTKANIAEYTKHSYKKYMKEFKGITKLLENLGRPHYKCRTKNITNEKLVELGKKHVKENPDIKLSRRNCYEHLKYTGEMITSRFKGWNNFIEIIGQKPQVIREPENLELTKEDILQVVKDYQKTNSQPLTRRNCEHLLKIRGTLITARFETWSNFLKEIGQDAYNLYGTPTVGQDGYKYDSIAEAEFCDRYLYNKFEYKRQVYYKDFLNTNRQYTCDFWVKGIGYIEVYSINKSNTDKKLLAENQGVKIYWINSRDVFKCKTLEDILKLEHKELKE